MPVGSNPWAVALSPDEQTVYVANAQSDDVSVVDMASHKVTRAVPVGCRIRFWSTTRVRQPVGTLIQSIVAAMHSAPMRERAAFS